jgi:hypothetical protein
LNAALTSYGIGKAIDVIFSYIYHQVDVAEKFFVRGDVNEEFPSLVTIL